MTEWHLTGTDDQGTPPMDQDRDTLIMGLYAALGPDSLVTSDGTRYGWGWTIVDEDGNDTDGGFEDTEEEAKEAVSRWEQAMLAELALPLWQVTVITFVHAPVATDAMDEVTRQLGDVDWKVINAKPAPEGEDAMEAILRLTLEED